MQQFIQVNDLSLLKSNELLIVVSESTRKGAFFYDYVTEDKSPNVEERIDLVGRVVYSIIFSSSSHPIFRQLAW